MRPDSATGAGPDGWSLARIAAPVLVVVAVVAIVATGTGLLRPGAELDGGGRSIGRSLGLAVAAAGIAALVILSRRHRPDRSGSPTMTALVAAAITMAALALLTWPFSPLVTIGGHDGGPDAALTGSPDEVGVGDAGAGSFGPGIAIPSTAVTVAVDSVTGETIPVVIDPDSGRIMAIDPETGVMTELVADPDGELALPVAVDPTTGAIGIIGIINPRTGEVGLIDVGIPPGAIDPEVLVDAPTIAGTNLKGLGTVDPGTDVDGVIDAGDLAIGDLDTASGGDLDVAHLLDELDIEQLREVTGGTLDIAEPGDAGAGDPAELEDDVSVDGGAEAPDTDVPDTDVESTGADDRGTMLNVLLPLLLLVLAAALVYALRGRPWRRTVPPLPEPPVDAERAEAGLAASLAAAADTGEPRASIIVAYSRLLEALTAAGAPRHSHEAPHEHLNRVLGPLGARPEPVHRLAELFVLGRFSDRPVTEVHRAAAMDALEASLADLRATAGLREPATAAATGP